MKSPTLVREMEVLQRFSAMAHARSAKALDFNGFKPLIQKHPAGGWACRGMHPHGLESYGWGATPSDAYENWTYDHIPF